MFERAEDGWEMCVLLVGVVGGEESIFGDGFFVLFESVVVVCFVFVFV